MFEQTDAFSSFSIKNKSESLQFYNDVLGCDTEEVVGGVVLHFPNGQSVFMYEKADHESAGFTVLNFPVDDIDKAVDDLTVKGIEMLLYEDLPDEQDGKGILRGKTLGTGPNIAWFKDPSGNILSILEE